MTIASLLPPQSTPFERSIEAVTARGPSIPVDFRSLVDPERSPEQFVPFFAWGHSVDLWDRDWSIEKKRAVAKAWLRLHRKKGTLAGIEEAVRFFDAQVVGVRRPPDAFYPDRTMTRAERDAYLARFRQLRFYAFRDRGLASYGAYASSGYRLRGLFPGRFFPGVTDAILRVGRRAFLFDPITGEETPVKRATRQTITDEKGAIEFDQVSLPGRAGFAFFAGHQPQGQKLFAARTSSRARVYSVAIDQQYSETRSILHISGVLPADQPIDVRPRKVRTKGQRVAGQLFPGKKDRMRTPLARVYLPATSAPLRIFDQVFLFDPARLPDKRGARTFAGHFRLGMSPYHARLTIEVRGKASPFAFHRFVRGFLIKPSKKKLNQAVEAIRLSKALRDKVLVKTRTMRTITVADGAKVGTFTVGALVRDV